MHIEPTTPAPPRAPRPNARAHAAAPAGTAKGFTRGTHRLIPPAETIARARAVMPVLGITRVANVTGLDTIGIPVVMVTRPNAKSLSVAQGKGLTLEAAQASGLMEAIESYHAEHVTLPLKLATLNQLRFTHPIVDLGRLPRYSISAFHAEQRILWVEGTDLHSGGPRWLPYEMVHTDFTLPLPPGSGAFFMSSSGLASGNHPLEAIGHGLYELIERDALTLWQFAGPEAQRATRVDPATIDDPSCRQVLDTYDRAGVTVVIWEITSDIGVAAFRCAIADRAPNPHRPLPPAGGMGCHPAREIALLRALTEAAQSRLTLVAGARDDMVSQRITPEAQQEACALIERRRTEPGPLRRLDDAPTRHSDCFEADIAWVLGRLRGAGLGEAVVVDLTRPELGIPVVRVVVPGLEVLHDMPGYTPGQRARAVIARRQAERPAPDEAETTEPGETTETTEDRAGNAQEAHR